MLMCDANIRVSYLCYKAVEIHTPSILCDFISPSLKEAKNELNNLPAWVSFIVTQSDRVKPAPPSPADVVLLCICSLCLDLLCFEIAFRPILLIFNFQALSTKFCLASSLKSVFVNLTELSLPNVEMSWSLKWPASKVELFLLKAHCNRDIMPPSTSFSFFPLTAVLLQALWQILSIFQSP